MIEENLKRRQSQVDHIFKLDQIREEYEIIPLSNIIALGGRPAGAPYLFR